ncbi:P-loop containing nucleoside triphosphate hydrolase [Paenibacillus sp. 32O-W]|uniref:AAA family ATPase n=1 Tax=Paenibacillus sp. 32O-W TaxID=1695218 RepID=UPI000721479A|nr:AAA family ATPase [Paenibacillus sp. 32O-W]ALS27161.1 P-loop containing nucleoside triphosphate hydrolase [Paenibacillus sp. 32O-W]
MKRIDLIRLATRNFKGIREFVLDAQGANTNIFGDNAAGKTTLFDGWLWLLFGKDSQNKADFEIKTLDKHGRPIHNLEHEVEAVLLIDGRRTTLRRVFKEKWTKKRGSVTAEFSGHTTDYFVDGVPCKESEYKAAVAEIVDEGVFRLLTSPTFFNEQLKWQDRRKILLDVSGDISDADVIASRPELAELSAILNGRTIEQHRKVVMARRKEINDELERIPVRIDEAERSKPDVSGLNEDELQTKIDALRAQIEAKQAELQRIQSGGEIAEKEKRMREIEAELLALKNELQAGTLDRIAAARREESRLKVEIEDLQRQIEALERRINQNAMAIQLKESEREKLRQKWYEVDGRKFVAPEQPETCVACGQTLPAERIAEARRKAEEAFNLEKARELEGITRTGKTMAEEIEGLKRQNEADVAKIESLRAEQQQKQDAHAAAAVHLAELESSMTDVTGDTRYVAKQQELEQVKSEILSLRSSTLSAVDAVRMDIAKLRTELELLESKRARFDQVRRIDERISELERHEKSLAEEFERLEHELFLLDEFTRAKVELLESRINSKFRVARFKLFNQQVNGGLEETCETMVDGVPYGSLNNAARHNVGLDIITTLSEHYGIAAPIFLDNAESITRPLETPGQQIRLIVSAGDKTLRVETTTEIKEAV